MEFVSNHYHKFKVSLSIAININKINRKQSFLYFLFLVHVLSELEPILFFLEKGEQEVFWLSVVVKQTTPN